MLISDQRIPEKPSLEIGADVLQRRPDLAMGLSLSIAMWANIEARLDAIFLLCTRDEAGLAAFQEKRGWDARAKFLHRTIRNTQGEEAGKEIRAILHAVAGPARKRHEVAHGIWGICAELSDDLILMDNDDFLDMARQANRDWGASDLNFVETARSGRSRGRVFATQRQKCPLFAIFWGQMETTSFPPNIASEGK